MSITRCMTIRKKCGFHVPVTSSVFTSRQTCEIKLCSHIWLASCLRTAGEVGRRVALRLVDTLRCLRISADRLTWTAQEININIIYTQVHLPRVLLVHVQLLLPQSQLRHTLSAARLSSCFRAKIIVNSLAVNSLISWKFLLYNLFVSVTNSSFLHNRSHHAWHHWLARDLSFIRSGTFILFYIYTII